MGSQTKQAQKGRQGRRFAWGPSLEAQDFACVRLVFRALLEEEDLPHCREDYENLRNTWRLSGSRALETLLLARTFIRDYLEVENPTFLNFLLVDMQVVRSPSLAESMRSEALARNPLLQPDSNTRTGRRAYAEAKRQAKVRDPFVST
jgi:hypothetical protein